jgi:hypothetical protein
MLWLESLASASVRYTAILTTSKLVLRCLVHHYYQNGEVCRNWHEEAYFQVYPFSFLVWRKCGGDGNPLHPSIRPRYSPFASYGVWKKLLNHDSVKVRLQSAPSAGKHSMVNVFLCLLRTGGISGLYAGVSAALLRQMTYSTVRFGVYEDLKYRFKASEAGKSRSQFALIPLSAISGAVGGVAGKPADILNVPMQSDSSKPVNERKNYRNAFGGIIRIVKDEGTRAPFRGVGAKSTLAVLMDTSQLASHEMFKQFCFEIFTYA